jgi:hypothetical protein
MENGRIEVARPELIEVFSTINGAVFQSDAESLIFIEFSGKSLQYKFPCFLRLKKVIDRIDIKRMMDASHPGIEIIFLCGAEDCFVLDLKEILNLRELLHGTFAMFQLNSIIKDRLHRHIV